LNDFNDLNGLNPTASPEGEADGGQAICATETTKG